MTQDIFAKVHCEHACRYIFKVKKVGNGILDISPGFSESGTIVGNDVRKHLLKSKTFSDALIEKRYTVKLQLYSGEANL